MRSRGGVARQGLRCTGALIAAVVLLARAAAADEPLYPHAEREFGPWGYIDKTGKTVVPLQFDWAEPFFEGRGAVMLDKKYGYVDNTGRLAVAMRFEGFSKYDPPPSFQGGRAVVKDGSQWRLIDRDGGVIIIDRDDTKVMSKRHGRAQTEVAAYFKLADDDRLLVFVGGKGGKYGAVDPSGRIVVEPEYDHMMPFSEGLAAVRRGGKTGFIDKGGNLVVPYEFENVGYFQDGRALTRHALAKPEVKKDKDGKIIHLSSRCGFIDRTGQLITPHQFDDCYDFHEERAAVWVAGQGWGVINLQGRFVVTPQFTNLVGLTFPAIFRRGGSSQRPERPGFSEGLMAVRNQDGVGYIDRDGKLAIGHKFKLASLFHDGLAVVQTSAEVGLGVPVEKNAVAIGVIDRAGKFVVPPIYEWAKLYPGGLVQVKFGDRLGYLDSAGRPLTFSQKDIDAYAAEKREKLKPPPRPEPGRAVFAKAGDTEYYLRLPDGMCALDSNSPEDRKILDDLWEKGVAASPPQRRPGKRGSKYPRRRGRGCKRPPRRSRPTLDCLPSARSSRNFAPTEI